MDTKYYNKRSGRWAPSSYKQRQLHNERIGWYTDRQIRETEKTESEKGPKALFLEELKNGYESAKKLIRNKYGENTFSDEILEKWRDEVNKNREEDDDAR